MVNHFDLLIAFPLLSSTSFILGHFKLYAKGKILEGQSLWFTDCIHLLCFMWHISYLIFNLFEILNTLCDCGFLPSAATATATAFTFLLLLFHLSLACIQNETSKSATITTKNNTVWMLYISLWSLGCAATNQHWSNFLKSLMTMKLMLMLMLSWLM